MRQRPPFQRLRSSGRARGAGRRGPGPPGRRVHHSRPPAGRRTGPAPQRQVPSGQGGDRRPGRPDVDRPGLHQPLRTRYRGHLHLPRSRRRLRLRFRHVHRERAGQGRDPRQPRGPADLRGHRPAHARPGSSRIHGPQPLPGPRLSHPGQRREAGPDLLHRGPEGRQRPGPLPLSPEHGAVLPRSPGRRQHRRAHREPGPDRQRLFAVPQGLREEGGRGDGAGRLRGPGRPAGQGFPPLLLALQGPGRAVVPELGGAGGRILHAPGLAALRRARGEGRGQERRSRPRQLGQHERGQDPPGQGGRPLHPRPSRPPRRVHPDRLRRRRHRFFGRARAGHGGERRPGPQIRRRHRGFRRDQHQRRPPRRPVADEATASGRATSSSSRTACRPSARPGRRTS